MVQHAVFASSLFFQSATDHKTEFLRFRAGLQWGLSLSSVYLLTFQTSFEEPENSLVLISPAAGFLEGVVFDGV